MADNGEDRRPTRDRPGLRRLRRLFGLDRLLGLALLAAALTVYVWNPYPIEMLRLKVFDFYQWAKPRQVDPRRPVIIVDIDERSLAEIGQWPWSRTTVAKLVDRLTAMHTAVIGFDMVFPEPDRTNPQVIARNTPGLDAQTRARLEALPSNDEVLAAAIRRNGRVVVGQATYQQVRQSDEADAAWSKPSVAVVGPDPRRFVPRVPGLVRNLPVIDQAAAGHGHFSLVPEPDGLVRRVPSLFNYKGVLYPALSLELLRVAVGRQTTLVRTNEKGVVSYGVAKGLVIPTDGEGRVWPYFSRHDPAKYVSAADILAGRVNPAVFRGRIALIGTSAVGLLDVRSTPTEEVMPGVEVHAQLIESALTGAYLKRPNNIGEAEFMLIVVGGLLMIWLVPLVGARWTLIVFLLVVGGASATSWYLFVAHRILFDAGQAVVSTLLLYTLLTYLGFAREESQRRQIREAFGHYLAPAMVERLAEDPSQLVLGGEARETSILFCDVRGFTAISENYDAAGLTRLINRLLTPLTDAILSRKGTVDKYMGDAIMAFWNAPLDDPGHARNACLAALDMNRRLVDLNATIEGEAAEEGRPFVPLRIGIGINSGEVVVGNMGSEQRFDYSVLGDSVNLASRLEGQTKLYGVGVIVGQETRAMAGPLAFLELDLIRVVGRRTAVQVFALVGDEAVAEDAAFQALVAAQGGMLDAYRARDWASAQAALAQCRAAADGFDMGGYYDLFSGRIADYEAAPPAADWDGVFDASHK